MQSMFVNDGLIPLCRETGQLRISRLTDIKKVCIIIHYTCHAIIVYCVCNIAVFNARVFISYK